MSKAVEAMEAKMLGLLTASVPGARITSLASRDSYSCLIIVDTDREKERINGDTRLHKDMKEAASALLGRTVYLSVESQETVDRRWGGNWDHVFR
jgi:hypothetical protein